MAHDATLHVKIDPATNDQLARLAAARKTSKGQLVRDGPMDTAERELFAALLRTFGAVEASCTVAPRSIRHRGPGCR